MKVTLEQIENIYNEAENIFNNPDKHSSTTMIEMLSKIDKLMKDYHLEKYGDIVVWMKLDTTSQI